MTAYVIIIRNETRDVAPFEQYFALAPLAPAKGVAYVSKNSRFEILEGGAAENVVIISFPTWDDARSWYFSDEYQAAVAHRLKAADYRTLLIDGEVNL